MTKVIINQGEKTLVKDFKFEIGNLYSIQEYNTMYVFLYTGDYFVPITNSSAFALKTKEYFIQLYGNLIIKQVSKITIEI